MTFTPAEKIKGIRPEDIGPYNTFRALAAQSILKVDSSCVIVCKVLWLKPLLRGTAIHTVFANKIRALESIYHHAEVTYFQRSSRYPYGYKGSIRTDGLYGFVDNPVFAIELKTGAAYVSKKEAESYYNNLPKGTRLYSIQESDF